MALGSITLKLYVYSGLENSYSDTDLKYTLNKNIISGQLNIILEVAELIRDYLDIDFDGTYTSHTKWVSAVVTYFDSNGEQYTYSNPQIFNYIALDGYGFFEDQINPELSRNVLISSSNVYLPEGTAGRLPIFAEGVGKVSIDSVDTEITDDGNSNQKIQYIAIPSDSSTIQVYDTDDTTLLKTIKVKNVCEPKFTPYKVVFQNKTGALQDLYFFKKTTESFSVTDEKFKRNIINSSSVTYQTNQTQNQRYNVNAKSNLVLNTGFINEDMNQTIEELFLSENVWIDYEGNVLPIIPTTKSMTLKTSLNDRLTDYTINFEFGFDKINNIR